MNFMVLGFGVLMLGVAILVIYFISLKSFSLLLNILDQKN